MHTERGRNLSRVIIPDYPRHRRMRPHAKRREVGLDTVMHPVHDPLGKGTHPSLDLPGIGHIDRRLNSATHLQRDDANLDKLIRGDDVEREQSPR